MTVKAERRKRRRRLAVAAALALAIGVATVTGGLWRRAAMERDRAETETLRAEANQLLALGRLEIENDPTGALAYAIASLERADEPVARLFALEALWRGPPALLPDFQETLTVTFSPDGRWLAGSSGLGDTTPSQVKLWSSAGGTPTIIQLPDIGKTRQLRFSAESNVMALVNYEHKVAHLISVPDGELVRTIPIPSDGKPDIRLSVRSGRLFTIAQHGSFTKIVGFPLDGGPPEDYGDLDGGLAIFANFIMPWAVAIDPDGSHLAYAPEHVKSPSGEIEAPVYLAPLSGLSRTSSKLVGTHQASISAVAFDPNGSRLATVDNSIEIRIWSLTEDGDLPLRVLHQPRQLIPSIRFDSSGSRLATASATSNAALWHLEGPPDAGPQQLRRSYRGTSGASEVAFHPRGSWMVTGGRGISAWPLERPYPLDLEGHEENIMDLAFLPDGRSLVSTSRDGTLRLWPLSPAAGSGSRVLYATGGSILSGLKVHPEGRQLLVGEAAGDVWLVSVDSGQRRRLGEIGSHAWATALGPRGRLAAAASTNAGHPIRIWDLETGVVRDLESRAAMTDLTFTPDGRLISVGREDGIRIWDLDDETSQKLSERAGRIDLSPDGRRLLAQNQVGRAPSLLDLEAGTWTHLEGHGSSGCAALDTSGSVAATIKTGTKWLQVGAATAAAPHLLVGSENLSCPVISPDGRWIASGHGNDIRLWPVPDLTQPPLHSLPLDELLAKVRTLTNLRVVRDPDSDTGWGWALDPFPGWEEAPTW
jgi:WD40 repeat protein